MSSNHSFKHEPLSMKLFIIISLSLIILAAVAVLFGLFFFGFLGLFTLLGIHYDHLFALLLFTCLFIFFSSFTDIFEKAVCLILENHLARQQPLLKQTILFLAYAALNWAIITILDDFMSSISIHFITRIVIAMLLAILDRATDE